LIELNQLQFENEFDKGEVAWAATHTKTCKQT
jgi:hypothetical protein